ncbi:MAG: glycosyltransferase family 4 protein [Patescibacteria group bacterium]
MKIVIATGVYKIGGPATYTRLMTEYLSSQNIKVEVLSFDEVKKFPKVIRHFIFFIKIFIKLFKTDLVFAQDPVSVGLPSLLAAKILRKKIIIRFVGDYAWEQSVQRFSVKDGIDAFQNNKYGFKVEFLRRIQIFVLNHVDKIITPSVYFGEVAKKWLKDKNKVKPIYNGIDTNLPILNKLEARKKLSLKNEDIILFTAGRLVPWKGIDVLIDIMPDLLKKDNRYRLMIVGDGPEEEKLKKQIKDLQLKKVVYFKGRLSREDLLLNLQAADIFILNTGFESFSFQVLEAMYYNVPVITTNICNLPEIIKNNQEGILVDYNNKTQIIAAIEKLLADSSFRDSIIKNAKQRAEYFSIQKTMDNLLELLKSLES